MTQPNQSELDKQINNIMFNEMGATGWNGSTKAIVYLNARNALTAYITANYTPNSEVAECKRTAIFKTIQTLVKAGAISDRAASSALVLLTKLKEVK